MSSLLKIHTVRRQLGLDPYSGPNQNLTTLSFFRFEDNERVHVGMALRRAKSHVKLLFYVSIHICTCR